MEQETQIDEAPETSGHSHTHVPPVEDRKLENNFNYHSPKNDQARRYELIRAELKRVAYLITNLSPASREQSLALTKLEEAMFWANAGIARNE